MRFGALSGLREASELAQAFQIVIRTQFGSLFAAAAASTFACVTHSPTPPSRYRLETFGTAALNDAGGSTVLGTHGHHRRRLALLAVLAVAGDRGMSRDQLLLLFWPESTQSRARHSLEQLVYALRSALGETAFLGANPIRLNPEEIASDVRDFQVAIDSGDVERAIAQHRGPFLDGFYLSNAPEFERWVEAERARLVAAYADAVEKAAKQAEAQRDHAAVVRWRHKLVEIDQLSARHATGLIRALMNAGDHAAALQFAQRYEIAVAEQLGTGVGPAVAALIAEVRDDAKSSSTSATAFPHRARSTPMHAVGETASSASSTLTKSRGRRSAYFVGAFAALAIIAGIVAWSHLSKSTGKGVGVSPSIAVLPFTNVGGDSQDAAIVDGLSEELTAVLAKVSGLNVVARSSALSFRNTREGITRIADSLHVDYVLEGSVQKNGTKLRVHVRVVARDGSTRWSDTYNRELGDQFDVQDDVARAVANELGIRLTVAGRQPIRRPPTRNVAAYELFLRGSDRALNRSDSAARLGVEYLQQAVALDSNYAAAWAVLGRMYARTASTTSKPERDRNFVLAEAAVRKSVALDDSLADAHAALGVNRMVSFDFEEAERELRRAISLDSLAEPPHEWMATLYLWTGRRGDALAHAMRARELDPLSPYATAELARSLIANDRCNEAVPLLESLKGLTPPLARVAPMIALCLARSERWEEAIALMRPVSGRGSKVNGFLGFLLARSGRREEAQNIERALRERWPRGESVAFDLAQVHAGLGNFNAAFDWLERAIGDRSITGAPVFVDIVSAPVYADLWKQQRYSEFRARIGLQNR